ncbi:MAG: hypothetical protein QF363_00245 [Planctomycetaceae bacterium]|nr:hypothetical protein [Planctomycetaceae bacterium]
MRNMKMLLATAVLLVPAPPAMGQQRLDDSTSPRRRQREDSSQSRRNQLTRRFEASSPKLGDPLPDLAGYTADGVRLNLRSLRGQHTVLVFGCLT